MVRDGKLYDIEKVAVMAGEFWKHTLYTEPFDATHVKDMATMAMNQGLLAILEVGGEVVGFCAALRFPLLGNATVMQATEIAWWVNPEARKGHNGIALMRFMESRCREQGIRYLNMIVMETCQPEVGSAIYMARGYVKSETSFTRVL